MSYDCLLKLLHLHLQLAGLLLVIAFSSDRFIKSLLQAAQLTQCRRLFFFQCMKLTSVLLIHLFCLMTSLDQLLYQLLLISAY